jgi:hypothetical protein
MLKRENTVHDTNANIIAIFYYCPKNLTQMQRKQSGKCRVISLSDKSKTQGQQWTSTVHTKKINTTLICDTIWAPWIQLIWLSKPPEFHIYEIVIPNIVVCII